MIAFSATSLDVDLLMWLVSLCVKGDPSPPFFDNEETLRTILATGRFECDDPEVGQLHCVDQFVEREITMIDLAERLDLLDKVSLSFSNIHALKLAYL